MKAYTKLSELTLMQNDVIASNNIAYKKINGSVSQIDGSV